MRHALDLINKCYETQEPCLDLAMCRLRDENIAAGNPLDVALSKCTHLRELNLSNWNLEERSLNYQKAGEFNIFNTPPPALNKLQGLTKLICAGDYGAEWGISDMSFVQHLSKLNTLDLSYNRIEEIKGLDYLTSLQIFNISGNQLKEVKGLDNLKALKKLFITDNQITEIKGLDQLKSLEILNFGRNQINELKGLDYLKSLYAFLIYENQLTEIGKLPNFAALQLLSLESNKITDISPVLPYLQRKEAKLKIVFAECNEGEVCLGNNPLGIPPLEIVKQGNEAVVNWFRAREQGSIINSEAKIILFGNENVGKTTLSRQLRKKSFSYIRNSTHGILIEPWIIREKEFPENLRQKINNTIVEHKNSEGEELTMPESLQLNLWDFGGQEYHNATHRLFMSSNVLYLLVWDGETDCQNDKHKEYPVSYWEKNINYFSASNVTFFIKNKVTSNQDAVIGELKCKIVLRDKRDKESIRQYKADIEQIQSRILHQLVNLAYIGKPFPKVYDDIKKELKKSKDKFIRYEEYISICLEKDTTAENIMHEDSQQETLIRFLDDTGVVVCFRFREKVQVAVLKDIVFTDPVWLTRVVYEILVKDVAVFDQLHVEKIASKHKMGAALWIEIMKQFELIFEIEKEGKKLFVVPQYLPEDCDNTQAYKMAKAGKLMQTTFVLHYPAFMPKSNFLRLIAQYGQQNIDYLYWKKALLFFLHTKTVECLLDSKERKITIQIQDRDETVAKEIFETLLAIDDADGLQVSVNEKDFVEIKKLRERIAMKNLEIETINGPAMDVSDFQFLFPKDKSQLPKIIFISYSHEDEAYREKLEKQLMMLIRGGYIETWHDRKLNPGDKWKDKIKEKLNEADIVLFLISPDFFSSEYIWKEEMRIIQERSKNKKPAIVIPVFLRHCDVEGTIFQDYQGIPRDTAGQQLWVVSEGVSQDEAFCKVAEEIRSLVKSNRIELNV